MEIKATEEQAQKAGMKKTDCRKCCVSDFKDALCEKDFCEKYYCEGSAEDFEKLLPHWIPCSERMPENGRQVLVYARSTHFALAKYDEMREADGTYKKQWVTFDAWKPFYTIKNVIAWMPLPKPWKGDTNE